MTNEQYGEAAMIISRASGVRAWMGREEEEAAIVRALANAPDDPDVQRAASLLRDRKRSETPA